MTHESSKNEKKNKSVEVLNISKTEKSPITSSVIDFVCADMEGQSAKQNCKFPIVHGDAEVCNRTCSNMNGAVLRNPEGLEQKILILE